ncbi:tyrosine-type recombinase/integrase [uncultured Mailhella sp.]|uniref:tyrosine-type recombinase/integrase n=1 Tax=uncultured Mailhella sp. TaxID=1981031 RepID=UPI00260EE24D|nr:tyrosine-type recombinase/integrase [uncultured Mailhella sp.]
MFGIENGQIEAFRRMLESEERAGGTVEKYVRDVREFAAWLGQRELDHEAAAAWKDQLLEKGLAPVTVNAKLSALNRFLAFMGLSDRRVKYLRIQKRLFRSRERELTKGEYLRLLETAKDRGKRRLALLMETVCATGIRVSEVKYITVEAAKTGRTDIFLKGKIRTILIPGKLCRKLLKYAEKQKTASGEIFLTRSGRGLTRRQIWAEMKGLCKAAGVAATKVFPHNLRHLFARTFYRACHDVAKLADVLGHSSIETTRIYLISTGTEHARRLERLGLIS